MKKKAMSRAGVSTAVFRIFLHPRYFIEIIKYLYVVMAYFFVNQWFSGKTPRVDVSHPLDKEIPYDNSHSALYIDFIKNWIRAISWMFQQQGRSFGSQAADFVKGLTLCYREAGWVYNKMKSTTPRPPAGKNFLTRFIHSVDPHLHCIPSLHVVVVCYTYIRIREFMEALGMEKNEQPELVYLYHQALKITESILYMKQHSLNCIGASLFFLHHLFPRYGDPEANRFVDDLFVLLETDLHIKDEARVAILERYGEMRKREAAAPGRDYREIILDSLRGYPPAPKQK